jgi:hypothetical protein
MCLAISRRMVSATDGRGVPGGSQRATSSPKGVVYQV